MNTPLAWAELLREALNLEIRVDIRDGDVFFCQCGSGQHGCFEENLDGCEKAAVWLAAIRQAIEVRDQLRSRELPRRRRMELRFLWRR